MNKRVVAAAAAALVPVFGPFVFGLPSALADPLANGYDVTCTKANDTQYDNHSTIGNRNPYTGKRGTHRPTR